MGEGATDCKVLADAFSRRFLAQFWFVKGDEDRCIQRWPVRPSQHASVLSAKRQRIITRDEGICGLCGLPVSLCDPTAPTYASVDHILPQRLGGRSAKNNLLLTHRWCNFQRNLIPYPLTIYAADEFRCQRCGELVNADPTSVDFVADRPCIEYSVPLDALEIWNWEYAWTCHQRCHRYHHKPDHNSRTSSSRLWATPAIASFHHWRIQPHLFAEDRGETMITNF
jgi:5-methylcytosine-specific restriction endonuclease McrA